MNCPRWIVICGLVAAVLLTATPVGAAPSGLPPVQETLVHVVQPGQNLFRIALRYGTTVTAIVDANGLSSHTIYVGQQLVIPRGSSGSSTPPSGARN
jgi:LysM repeat protein